MHKWLPQGQYDKSTVCERPSGAAVRDTHSLKPAGATIQEAKRDSCNPPVQTLTTVNTEWDVHVMRRIRQLLNMSYPAGRDRAGRCSR